MTTQDKLISRKLTLIELAEFLKNVSQACKIHGVFFKDIPLDFNLGPKQLAQHRRITRICEVGIEIILNEVEKCGKVGVADAFCLRLASFSYQI